MTTLIGSIVKSNTHIDYVCQVFAPTEREEQPGLDLYAFGTFVAIDLDDGEAELVGVVYNTILLNAEFGNLGPRLSLRADQEIFTPDLMYETATLVGVLALGWQPLGGSVGGPQQGVPRLAAAVGAAVRCLSADEIRRFHQDAQGQLALRYTATLLGLNNPLVPALLLDIIDRLSLLFPQQQNMLQVMRNNVAWKSMVQPAG